MNTMIVIVLILGVVYGIAAFTGVIKGVTRGFENDPGAAYHSQDLNEKQSQKMKDADDKNRQLMEHVQAQMDRMKH